MLQPKNLENRSEVSFRIGPHQYHTILQKTQNWRIWRVWKIRWYSLRYSYLLPQIFCRYFFAHLGEKILWIDEVFHTHTTKENINNTHKQPATAFALVSCIHNHFLPVSSRLSSIPSCLFFAVFLPCCLHVSQTVVIISPWTDSSARSFIALATITKLLHYH